MAKPLTDQERDPLLSIRIPEGPPLNLERPGRVLEVLRPFLYPERIARFQATLKRRTRRLTALLEEVHDHHNLSACMRSCDAFGIQDLHIVPAADSPLEVSKGVGAGAHRWLTVHIHPDIETAASRLRDAGYLLAATDLGEGAPAPVGELPVDGPVCVCFGNERDGISPTLRQISDLRVQIPMVGFVESLNISVAFAVTMFTARQKMEREEGVGIALSEEERTLLLDQWAFRDVPRAESVLEELARRHGD